MMQSAHYLAQNGNFEKPLILQNAIQIKNFIF